MVVGVESCALQRHLSWPLYYYAEQSVLLKLSTFLL